MFKLLKIQSGSFAIGTMGIVLLFTGCAQQPKTLFSYPQLPQKNISVYVDNSIAIEKQKNVVDAYVKIINKGDTFNVEINKDPKVSKLDMSTEQSNVYVKCLKTVNQAKINDYIGFTTYNYNYGMDDDFLNKERTRTYYNKKYKATNINDAAFEIMGFASKKEAMDIFIQLLRGTSKWDVFSSEISSELQSKDLKFHFKNTFPGRGFRFDPVALENENRLIIIPKVLDFSIKNEFQKVLKDDGYTIVDDRTKADIVVETETLYYGTKHDSEPALQKIRERLNIAKKEEKSHDETTKKIGTLANQSSQASALGHSTMSKGLARLAGVKLATGLLSTVFGGNEYNGYAMGIITVYKDNNVVYSKDYARNIKNTVLNAKGECITNAQNVAISRTLIGDDLYKAISF